MTTKSLICYVKVFNMLKSLQLMLQCTIEFQLYNLSRNIFLWVKFSNYTYMWLPPALMKNILTIIKNLELNIHKNSELKNGVGKIKEKTTLRSRIDVTLPRLIFFLKKNPTPRPRSYQDHPFINFIYFLLRKFFVFAKL